MSTDSWPSSKEQLARDLAKVVTVGVGRPPRGKDTIDTLVAVAAQLSADPKLTPLRQVADAIEASISRQSPEANSEAAALLFGTHEDTQGQPRVGIRRELAAKKLNVEVATFKEKRERNICHDLADDMLRHLPVDLSPTSPPAQPPDVPVVRPEPDGQDQQEPSSAQHALSRRKPVLAGSALLLLLVAIVLVISRPWQEAGAATHTELARLTAEAERPLSLNQTPQPGTTSPVLGFGDELGGRRTYQYVVNTLSSYAPVLDSFTDAPEHVGDERKFVRVETGSKWYAHRPHWLKPAATAKPGDLVYVWVYLANDAPEEHNCNELVGPTIATNTRVRLTVWNSTDDRLHVIRAWLSADNTTPKWITDAAAVITSTARPLSFDPTDSWQYAISPSQFAHEAPLPNQDFFDAGGMALSSNGLLGSCWANRWAMVFAFHQ